MKRRLLNLLVNVTCNGQPVSSLYGCVHDGVLCSDNGMCISNRCSCINRRTGQFCQSYSLHDTNSNDALAISLGEFTGLSINITCKLTEFVRCGDPFSNVGGCSAVLHRNSFSHEEV